MTPTPTRQAARSQYWTIPNAICAFRLLASPVLPILGWLDQPIWCLGLVVVLFASDWLDGKLAILLRQQTTFGARLDSVADVTFYACVLAALALLCREVLMREAVWIGMAVGSYLLSFTIALAKYRRMPSYHTRMAKTSWLLVFAAVVALFAGGSVWFLRVAAIGVTVTNLEALLITLRLPEWRTNVPSVFHAVRKESGSC